MENKVKNILVLSPQKPSHKNGGAHLLESRFNLLSKKYNLFLIFKGEKYSAGDLEYFKKSKLIIKTKPKNILGFIFRYFILTNFYVYFYILKYKINIVQVEFFDTLFYSIFLYPFKLFGLKIFYTAHDIQSLYYEEKTLKYNVINFIEKNLIKYFINTVFVWGNDDKNELIKWGINSNKIKIIPPIMDEFTKKTWELNKTTNFVFMGSFNHYPNKDSLKIILNIWPEIKKKSPESKLYLITGGNSNLNLNDSSIIDCGFVSEPEEILSKCNIFLAPIISGTGIKVKLIESFRFGIPVISTDLGFRNFDDIDKNIVFSLNEKDFLDKIFKILDNDCDLEKISNYEKMYFMEYFSNKNINNYGKYYG